MGRTHWLLLALLATPPALLAGQAAQRVGGSGLEIGASEAGSTLAARCRAEASGMDPFLAQLDEARAIDDEERSKEAIRALEPEARRMAAEAPNDAAAQFRLAAVMGALLEHESSTGRMSGAPDLNDQARRVLALDPQHPGANYMIGKLHASVLRLSGLKRFLAKQMMGGGVLDDATWDEAQRRLEQAVRGGPCVPEHHFELARVFAHHGDTAGWERELAAVLELTEGGTGSDARLRTRAYEFQREWRGED